MSLTGKEISIAKKYIERRSTSVLIRDVRLNNNEKPCHALQISKNLKNDQPSQRLVRTLTPSGCNHRLVKPPGRAIG